MEMKKCKGMHFASTQQITHIIGSAFVFYFMLVFGTGGWAEPVVRCLVECSHWEVFGSKALFEFLLCSRVFGLSIRLVLCLRLKRHSQLAASWACFSSAFGTPLS